MKRHLHRLSAVVLVFCLLSAAISSAGAETVEGCSVAPDASDTISLGSAALEESAAFIPQEETTVHIIAQVAADNLPPIVNGCSVSPDTPGTISLGSAAMDASADFTVLAESTLHFTAQADSSGVDVPLTAVITIAQRAGSTALTTSVTIRTDDPDCAALIHSVTVSLKYVNHTESTTPDSGDGFLLCTDAPTNYLSGVYGSNQTFTPGHTIAVSATIDTPVLEHAAWTGEPVSTSRLVTVR